MRILALDAALASCSVALLDCGDVLAEQSLPGGRGQHHLLPVMARNVLAAAPHPDAIAVTIGPGSFTGLRASIALAHGLAAGLCPVIGVTVAEALAEAVALPDGWALWTAIDSRRGRIFLDQGSGFSAVALASIPAPQGPVAVAGDAAADLVARLAAKGCQMMLTQARQPQARHVAQIGLRRLQGALPALPAQPLYIDPPEASLPRGGLRPMPVA